MTAAARTVLGPSPQCDDIVVEVFAKLWLAPEKFDPARGSLLGYLRVMARARSIDWLRGETSRRRREVEDARRPTADVPSVDRDLLSSESAAEVRRAVDRLPEEQREVIDLAYLGGISYRAVAVRLGLPEGTVKARIRRGLQRLRCDDELGAFSGMTPTASCASALSALAGGEQVRTA